MLALMNTLCICIAEKRFKDSKRNTGFDLIGDTPCMLYRT